MTDKQSFEVNARFEYGAHLTPNAKCKDINIEELKSQLKRKEQESEELKKELEAVYDDCKGCPTCNEALYNANLYAKECRELKQTLAEIKEIAEAESYLSPQSTGY